MNPKLLTGLKWVGTGTQVSGVFLLSGRAAEPPVAFAVMLLGSAAWVVAAVSMREWSVVALNAAFTVSNVLGVYRWTA